jgi:hypothetical protein
MPLVALLTDFGTQDIYVGVMKAVVLATCPEATLVDLTHEIAPQDIAQAAFCLAAAHTVFPSGSVFVAIVDPGVGSARRGLAIEADGWRFVGPDNGLFTLVLEQYPRARVHVLRNRALFRPHVSATFHGRDVFAPVAAQLACGLPLAEVGPEIDDAVRLELGRARALDPDTWEAPVVHVDRFGNATTAFDAALLDVLLARVEGASGALSVEVCGQVVPLVRTYTDVPPGAACALLGSAARLELAVREGHAARHLGLGVGTLVRLRVRLPPGPHPHVR